MDNYKYVPGYQSILAMVGMNKRYREMKPILYNIKAMTESNIQVL